MIIVMTILAKDEEDILRENVEYHRSQGVDHFIAMDNASTDRTPEILKCYEKQGILKYIYQAGAYHQTKWVTAMARMAYNEFNADWVINNDADEFWWPSDGNLKTAFSKIPRKSHIVRARRHNLLLNMEDSNDLFYKNMIYRRKNSINPIGKPLPPKVCHRGAPSIIVQPGSHGVKGISQSEVYDADMLEIYHYPFRSFEQLRSKVRNIGEGYEKNPQTNKKTGTGPGKAMRNVYENYKDNPESLGSFFLSHALNREQIQSGLKTGKIVEDRKLSEYLCNLLP